MAGRSFFPSSLSLARLLILLLGTLLVLLPGARAADPEVSTKYFPNLPSRLFYFDDSPVRPTLSLSSYCRDRD
ncbi:hypothetical protein CALVIDRAFT_540596 [Calocera viscosa TUFC12733]|uniref:Uncharacterized protein n=1 Tax=Calocera viscosa (strain TUFC12733) TaxID=1330018 RepID=A0A167ISR1_CALVF|nr:hypothetical protein CALVIDRAFT_540596 [Calocera viscosa TUFC12733]